MRNYWLMKSEPDVYSWSMLVKDKSTHWDGVRNYQARNIMRDSMKMGDLVFFYHSNCKPPHIAELQESAKNLIPTLLLGIRNQNIMIRNLLKKIQDGL